MKTGKLALAALAAIGMTVLAQPAQARDQIRIVGSSTVYPFSTAVAEQFGRASGFKTPVVESTGSGGGIKLFCAGVGAEHPDITNSSRRIKGSELETCAKNGVTDVAEVKIGYDGIVLANSKKSPLYKLTVKQVYLALAKDVPANADGSEVKPNTAMYWSDVDASLPKVKIRVFGPPPTSGTRDAFAELVMEHACASYPAMKALEKSDKKKFQAVCMGVREDGAYVEAGENDNLIVQKLDADPEALGIFGYSFLEQNADKVQGSIMNDQAPTFENISSGAYPVSRSMYFYVKKKHVGMVPGIQEYVNEFASERAWGNEGYLADKGLIPMGDSERAQQAKSAMALAPVTKDMLK
ncbi:MAG: substrate-binding domain-containing protein [Magnetococcus sp. WYHC-3]